MKKTINVLVIEDNEFYSNLLSNAIQQSLNPILVKGKYQLVLRSFTDAAEYMRKIKSGELAFDYTAVFIDYYLGDGIKLLKEQSSDAMVVLLSQEKTIKEKSNLIPFDYFVVKDKFAPALCGLYLQQYIENKYSVSLDQ
jgi:adenine C2-methylase RlmN of 23S rRNA A2503 and tRNA A37